MAKTVIKNLGVSIAALLAAYAVSKMADKNTSFVDTRMAITSLTLQTLKSCIEDQLTKNSASSVSTIGTTVSR